MVKVWIDGLQLLLFPQGAVLLPSSAAPYLAIEAGTACYRKIKEARNVFYWVNPYDILHACFRKPTRLLATSASQSAAHHAVLGSNSVSIAAATAHGQHMSRGMGMHEHRRAWGPRAMVPQGLGHTVACGDRR